MKRNQHTALRVVFWMFTVLGIVPVVIGIFFAVMQFFIIKNAEEVKAVITEIETYEGNDGDTHHTVYVDYTIDGEKQKHVRYGRYSSGMKEGDKVRIHCNPKHPQRILPEVAFYILGSILIFMGMPFLVIGIIPLILLGVADSGKKKLLETGRTIYAQVDRVDRNMLYTVNKRRSFILYCHYQDPGSGRVYQFKSGDIWIDPTPYFPPGSQVPVVVQGDNFSKYHVDIDRALAAQGIDVNISPRPQV